MGVQLEVHLVLTWRPGLPRWREYWTSASAGMCKEQSEPEVSESLESVDGRVARTCGGARSRSRRVDTLFLLLFLITGNPRHHKHNSHHEHYLSLHTQCWNMSWGQPQQAGLQVLEIQMSGKGWVHHRGWHQLEFETGFQWLVWQI